ncbi:MAG: dihydrofolate reductase [Flavobacteriaceae bacterium]|jgi:dihydrofolate reductase
MSTTHLCLIAAIGTNRSLGKEGKLLWHLPDDFAHFKHTTMGYPIIMGRKTFESFPKPLPGRKHIIISRNQDYSVSHPDCFVVHDLEEAIELVNDSAIAFVVGGGEIYSLALSKAQEVCLTEVDGVFEADAFFPVLHPDEWELVESIAHQQDERHAYSFKINTYLRTL